MGLVKLPAKKDYWRQGGVWSTHGVISGMPRDWFHYIWWYFHVSNEEAETTNNTKDEEDNIDKMFDVFAGLEMEGYKRDDQVNHNKDGIEEGANAWGIDNPDWISHTFANGTDEINNNDIADDDNMQTGYHKGEKF